MKIIPFSKKKAWIAPILFAAALSLASVAALACGQEDHAASSGAQSNIDALLMPAAHADAVAQSVPGTHTARIKIAGLHCSSCAKMINVNLNKVNGVQSVAWDKKKNIVAVTYAEGSTTPDELLKAIRSAGDDFNATVIE